MQQIMLSRGRRPHRQGSLTMCTIFKSCTRYFKSLITRCAFADIIPVYHFGNSQLLGYHGSEWISRKLRATVGMFWGWRGLPLPYRHDLVSCVGLPVKGDCWPLSASSCAGKIACKRNINCAQLLMYCSQP